MIPFILGLLGGLIGYVINKQADRFISTPKLKILCKEGSRVEPRLWHLFAGTRRGSAVLRVQVVNKSIFVAKGCRVYLTELEMLDEVEDKFLLRSCIPFDWSIPEVGEDIRKFDLPKGLTLSLEVMNVYTNLEPHRLNADEEGMSRDDLSVYNPDVYEHTIGVGMPVKLDSQYPLRHDRRYRVSIVVTADNAEPYYFRFDVGFGHVDGIYHIELSNRSEGYQSAFINAIEMFKTDILAGQG